MFSAMTAKFGRPACETFQRHGDRLPRPLLAGLLAGAVTTFGVLVIRRRREWGRRHADYAAYFAAGVLVSVSFLHLIPLAIDLNPHAPVWLLAGYFFL